MYLLYVLERPYVFFNKLKEINMVKSALQAG